MRLCKQLSVLLLLIAAAAILLAFGKGVDMVSGHPDWTRAVKLIGIDPDGNLLPILVDEHGQLTIPFKGVNPTDDLVTVAVDADGQLFAVMRGASGEDLAVDDDGFLGAVVKGVGAGGVTRNILVDGSGRIIMVPRGQSGYYMAVDADGFLGAIMKGVGSGGVTRDVLVDSGGRIIMVPRGESGYYMAIDSDGYMTAVLKGDFEGALRTIGLDDDGRISGYLVDAEDQWGEILKVGTAELAARLGSPVSWDRRGQVQHVFDFGKGFHGLQASTAGAGTTITLDPTVWQNGGYAALLHTAAIANCEAFVGGRLSGAPSDRYGVSATWASANSPDFLYLGLKHYKGTVKQEARLLFDDGAEELQYYDSDGNYQKICDLVLSASNYSFHNIKLVVDFDAGVYVRALVNSTEYTLSAAVKTSSVPSGAEFLLYRFHVDGYDAITSDTYLDNMIFTVNEP